MKFEVTILGSGSATPVYNRNPSSQVLNCNEKIYLIDCGEGTQQQLIKFGIKAAKIDQIFISHLHGDHFFGLIGLLSSLNLNGREKPLYVFGPAGLDEILQLQFHYSDTQLRYQLIFEKILASQSKVIFQNYDVIVETIILNHRIPCTGFKFTEKKRLRKLIIEKLEKDKVPIYFYQSLKKGEDVVLADGKLVKNKDYTLDPPHSRSYAYCSDTLADNAYFDMIKNCDTLYHEATFMHSMLERAKETHHSTAKQAAEIASAVKAKKLLIGHFSSRYKTLSGLLEEAQLIFPKTKLALEGETFQL